MSYLFRRLVRITCTFTRLKAGTVIRLVFKILRISIILKLTSKKETEILRKRKKGTEGVVKLELFQSKFGTKKISERRRQILHICVSKP